eukprot:CAMPEP_0115187584 /NCGR_PEP_ID=MMETSP0270-20121206/10568_1 /TAXON_ID=71861 /ORGANISM="Scrippsiella trochoidea, Strain CCMP3099" /LENGTH=107 /DNA_ID=CAMNT_0002600735 /DNA_START=217 /DNA_END=540 /DNA_ORIENTATION=-
MSTEPTLRSFPCPSLCTSVEVLTSPSSCVGASVVVAPLQDATALRAFLTGIDLCVLELEIHIQFCLKNSDLPRFMEDVCKPTRAARRIAQGLTWKQPGEVPHPKLAE